MSIEATMVEKIQELKKCQAQWQEELIKQQQEQLEKLSNEQRLICNALSLSIEEMSLSGVSLKELIEQEKEQEIISDLIDFHTPNKPCEISDNFSNVTLMNEENNKHINLKKAVNNSLCDLHSHVECNNLYNKHSYNSHISIDTVQSFSSKVSDRQHISIDELPVPSPKKDFNILLEERLKDSEIVNIKNKTKPLIKKPFLKKGQGLARFLPNCSSNVTLKNTSKPRSASFSNAMQTRNNKPYKTSKLERCNSLLRSKTADAFKKSTTNDVILSQPKLNIKNVPRPRKRIYSKSIGPVVNSIIEKQKPVEIISDTNSSDLEIKNKRELDEVRIFELLEDKVENSSFCSTSSTVVAFLQQSTPLKDKALLHSASKQQVSLNDISNQRLEKIIYASKAKSLQLSNSQENIKDQIHLCWDKIPVSKIKDKTPTRTVLPYGTDIEHYQDYFNNQELSEDENSVSLHVRFAEHNEYKTMTDTSSISSNSEMTINYIDNTGAWSDFSVTPDSSDVESILSVPIKTDNKWSGDKESISSNFMKQIQDNNSENGNAFKNEVHNEEYEEENKENEEESENEFKQANVTLQNDNTLIDENTSVFKSQLLKTRLLELEREIEIFRKESASLTFQKQKLQEERTKLSEEQINIRRIIKEKEEVLEMAKKKTESILQEEKKRLAREKISLENRMKDAWEKVQKSKQERQEIQILKDELEDLKEEYKEKESKWSATNARQRSQIRVLQTENSKLKQELEKLQQKKNAKLKKPVTTNTRAIHRINKFLAERKKVSSLKNDEELKMSNNVDMKYEDLELVEEKCQEKEIKKIKVLKTVESISRTRNLYESLLKDATEGSTDIEEKNIINKYANFEKQTQDYSNYDTNSINSVLHEGQVESNNCSNERNNEIEPDDKQGIKEIYHPNGHIEYWYPNGNVKKVFPDKFLTKMIYYNGDVRETNKSGIVKYFYASSRTWHTTMSDGLEILEFPDGQVERRSKNGTIEVSFPDGSVKIVQTDGSEKWALRDGTIAETSADGEKILTLPNGQKEIHTKDHKRREYPDGTVKLIYPDGIQETRYANGRIRLKDKDGNLIMDSH